MDVLRHLGAAGYGGGGWWSNWHGDGLATKDGRFLGNCCFLRGELDALAVVDRDVVGGHLGLLDLDVAFAAFTDARSGGVGWSGKLGNGFLLLQALLSLGGQVILEGFQDLVFFLVRDRR